MLIDALISAAAAAGIVTLIRFGNRQLSNSSWGVTSDLIFAAGLIVSVIVLVVFMFRSIATGLAALAGIIIYAIWAVYGATDEIVKGEAPIFDEAVSPQMNLEMMQLENQLASKPAQPNSSPQPGRNLTSPPPLAPPPQDPPAPVSDSQTQPGLGIDSARRLSQRLDDMDV